MPRPGNSIEKRDAVAAFLVKNGWTKHGYHKFYRDQRGTEFRAKVRLNRITLEVHVGWVWVRCAVVSYQTDVTFYRNGQVGYIPGLYPRQYDALSPTPDLKKTPDEATIERYRAALEKIARADPTRRTVQQLRDCARSALEPNTAARLARWPPRTIHDEGHPAAGCIRDE